MIKSLGFAVACKLVVILAFGSFMAFAEETLPPETESNYIVNPRGCMGLGDTPEEDGLVLVLTYDDVWKVEGQKIVRGKGDKFTYATVPCSLKSELESCSTLRGFFKLKQGSGIFNLPEASEYRCIQ